MQQLQTIKFDVVEGLDELVVVEYHQLE